MVYGKLIIGVFMANLSFISAIVAIIAALLSLWALFEQRRIAKLNANIAFLLEGQRNLNENTDLLEIHNIRNNDLEEIGINHRELVYILNSLYAGQVYHFISAKRKIRLSKYRTNLLDNEKVKLAWIHIIRNKMVTDSAFVKAIDKHYELIQNRKIV